MWLMSPGRAVENLLHGYALDATALGSLPTINLPGVSVAVRDMVGALERCAGGSASDRIRWERDPLIERIVNTWPGRFATPRAAALGFQGDASFDDIVRAHVAGSAAGPASAAAME
jgi:D-erythronate 2-dehydrogenase